jgi:serine/threonine protein kinase
LHAFISTCDGLAYLRGGKSYLNTKDYKPVPGWQPILHRDIKPENILLKSRHERSSSKYPYCVISDFGLVCEETHPDREQQSGFALGSCTYHAPELCWPISDFPYRTLDSFPGNQRHSAQSDLWALGATIFNLADTTATPATSDWARREGTHLTCAGLPDQWRRYVEAQVDVWEYFRMWMTTQESRVDPLTVDVRFYSRKLDQAVRMATLWDERRRPDAVGMMRWFNGLKLGSIKREPLPGWLWAAKSHEFSALAAKAQREGRDLV